MQRVVEVELARLDVYEGCAPGSEDLGFERVSTAVTLAGGRRVEAWLYAYNQPVDDLPRIPHGDYLRYLKDDLREVRQ